MSPSYKGFRRSLGLLMLTLAGCDTPEDIMPTTPPGAVIPRTPPAGESPAQAQGEAASVTRKLGQCNKPVAYTPASPTAKGETKTTKNGVKYETLKPGTGEELKPKPGRVAVLHFVGTLENGTVFDSSRDSGEPFKATIGTGQLIRGWDEGLPGMKVGETRRLWVPAAMGYGAQEQTKIPANSNLIFEVELLNLLN